jgi:hypothetical protein
VGHGVGRGSRPGYRPWSCLDHAGVLPAPAGGVVLAVGCTVFQTWRSGAPWALQVRVLHAPAVAGRAAVPDPLDGVLACTLGGPGDTRRSQTPREGRSGAPAGCAEHPPLRGTWRRRTPSQAGGGPGAIRVVRWSPDSQSWQNSNGSSVEPVSSYVVGSTVLPQRPGWRSSDRSWRTGPRSQPL